MLQRRHASVLLLVAACTVSNTENPFASGTATAATVATTASTTAEEGSGEDSSDSGEAGSDSGGSSSEGGETSTGEMGSTSTTPGESSSGAVDPTDGQPADGMYSMCTAAADCGNIPILCITNADMTDGFCSETGCANAAADCDPAPGGTATPTCVGPIDIDGDDEMVCALSCAAGVCPTGMACVNFTDLGMICM